MMKEKYADKLDLKIYPLDSDEALPYQFRSSTNVLLDKELIAVDIATDTEKMDKYLSAKLVD
ncbi:MAG TPA: hypothetical protein PKZ12_02085 [Smithellaceae bacterium]|nr:hypothetical protein [Smithellaceae bacterium]